MSGGGNGRSFYAIINETKPIKMNVCLWDGSWKGVVVVIVISLPRCSFFPSAFNASHRHFNQFSNKWQSKNFATTNRLSYFSIRSISNIQAFWSCNHCAVDSGVLLMRMMMTVLLTVSYKLLMFILNSLKFDAVVFVKKLSAIRRSERFILTQFNVQCKHWTMLNMQ